MKQLYNTPIYLYNRIINSIEKEEKISVIRKRFIISLLFFITSFAGLIFSILLLDHNIEISGFKQIFSLLFLDFNTITIYLKDFLISLLEIFPFYEISLLCVIFLLFFTVSKIFILNFKKILHYNHLKA